MCHEATVREAHNVELRCVHWVVRDQLIDESREVTYVIDLLAPEVAASWMCVPKPAVLPVSSAIRRHDEELVLSAQLGEAEYFEGRCAVGTKTVEKARKNCAGCQELFMKTAQSTCTSA